MVPEDIECPPENIGRMLQTRGYEWMKATPFEECLDDHRKLAEFFSGWKFDRVAAALWTMSRVMWEM